MHTEQAKEEATRYLTTSQTKTNLVHITINQCVGIQITERTAVNPKQASMANLVNTDTSKLCYNSNLKIANWL